MKLGKIKISDVLLQEENIKDLNALFSIFIPLHIEDRKIADRCMIYTGYCEQFDDITKELEMPPYYQVIINENGQATIIKDQ